MMLKRWNTYRVLWSLLVLPAAWFGPEHGSWSLEDQLRRLDFCTHGDSLARTHNSVVVADLGVTPLATALHRGAHAFGERPYRLLFAIIAVGAGWLCAAGGYAAAWLLIPLTLSAIIPGEYGLTLLLVWPLLYLLTRDKRPGAAQIAVAAVAGAVATALSPLLIPVIVILLFQAGARGWSREAIIAAGCWGIVASFLSAEFASHLPLFAAPSGESILMNLRRVAGMDSDPVWSGVVLASWLMGTLLMTRNGTVPRTAGGGLLAVGFGVFQHRLWSAALTSGQIDGQISLLALAPWILLAGLPPYRRRPTGVALLLALLFGVLALRIPEDPQALPVAAAVLLPLWLIDLKKNGRDRGPAFVSLLLLTALNTAAFSAIVYDRAQATADHVRLLEPRAGSPLVISPPKLGFEVAPLWRQREIYGAHDRDQLLATALEFRQTHVDTFYLLLDAHYPLYVETFPGGKPAWPTQMTVTNGGTIHRTQRRLYQLVTNPTDSLWQQWEQ
ncbi:hypothetical protein HZB60_00160 [candidate division KSB1 bacterium]|nr:hypothetical protein [candidate division KSB1 bacterium]